MDYEKLLLKALSRIDSLEDELSLLNNRVVTIEKKTGTRKTQQDIPEMIVDYSNTSNNGEGKIVFSTNDSIRRAIRKMAEQEEITDDLLNKFLNFEWCKSNLKLSYTLLRESRFGRFDDKQYARYWDELITIRGKSYYICQEWYPPKRMQFEYWYNNYVQRK